MTSSAISNSTAKLELVPKAAIDSRGSGAAVELGPLAGKPLLVVLRVDEIIEQESLHVSVWGSADGNGWGQKPLFWFPQVFYQGITPAALDLTQRQDVKFLQTRWEVNRWGRGYPRPHFSLSVTAEKLNAQG
jgi:hypothetical protein